jgi:hypothetical protein
LPRLPKFLINLYLPPVRQNEIAVELARHVRQEFAARAHWPSRYNGRTRAAASSRRPRESEDPYAAADR